MSIFITFASYSKLKTTCNDNCDNTDDDDYYSQFNNKPISNFTITTDNVNNSRKAYTAQMSN